MRYFGFCFWFDVGINMIKQNLLWMNLITIPADAGIFGAGGRTPTPKYATHVIFDLDL